MFNSSKWITTDLYPCVMPSSTNKVNISTYFRKEFLCAGKVKSATLSVCALGLGVCTVNGQNVTDAVLTTPFTAYDHRVYYNTYDVSGLVNSGENAVGIHLGNGFYNENNSVWNDMMAPWRDQPKFILELSVECEDGSKVNVFSDLSWKCSVGPCTYNHMRQGEIYDARLEQKGFDKAGFDDLQWKTSILAREPGGLLGTTDMPPVRVCKTYKPIKCENGIYDFGICMSGWVKIKTKGECGQTVKIHFDDFMDENGKLGGKCGEFAKGFGAPVCNECIFICSGGEDEYRPAFTYFGFRYVQVENAPESFEIEAEFLHADFENVGEFSSSDKMLNAIHNACVQSLASNYMWMPTDCPHREQNGWTGDAELSCDQMFLNFDIFKSYRKWMYDFRDAQRPSGQLPGIVPSAGWGYNWGNGPIWDCAIIVIPYNSYIYAKNTELISEFWENMERYMGYAERMSVDGIVKFGLGDWVPYNRNRVCPDEVIHTALYSALAKMMATMAAAVGKDGGKWTEIAENSKKLWREHFLDRSDLKQYQTYYAVAIYYGMLDGDENKRFGDELAELVRSNGMHIDCGILGNKCIYTALSETGHIDICYDMLTVPTCPSFAYWINNGLTTLSELWNYKDSSSQIHHMFSEPDHWLYKYLCGICYAEEGIEIAPVYTDRVERVKASQKGFSVERNGHNVKVVTKVPLVLRKKEGAERVGSGEYEFSV